MRAEISGLSKVSCRERPHKALGGAGAAVAP